MSDTASIIRASMAADADAVRVIGQNIANTETVAYRRQIPRADTSFTQALNEADGIAATNEVMIDQRAGTLRSTGEPLNVALEGTGFFALQGNGGIQLTRRGDFRVSADGTLTSASGLPVLGQNGTIHVGAAIPKINTDGSVIVGSDVVDQLRLVSVADTKSLHYLGDGTYSAPTESLQDTSSALVRQGHLEASNVAPVGEMVQLIEAVRHFEASQRLARGYDDMLGKAISELGKVG